MNRFVGSLLMPWLVWACMAQARETSMEQKTRAVQNEGPVYATQRVDSIELTKLVPNAKKVSPISSRTEPELIEPKGQEQTSVWTTDQEIYLKSVDKILLFNVVTTEIGSRKLELDSELEENNRKDFINTLLDNSSYTDNYQTNDEKKKRFTPHYQMLLEKEEEKLTLMFDIEGMEMMVANLMDRKRFPIGESIVQKIKTLKKN